jgi:signal transduction histidine kinase
VRRRLLISYLAVAALVLALLEVPLAVSYAHNERQDLAGKVQRDAVALSTLVEDSLESHTPVSPAVRRIASNYTNETGGRIVVVDARGRSLVDSEPTTSIDYSSRPEIATALGGTIATGVRHSTTLHTDLMYVAVPVASSGVVHGAVRITYPMSEVNGRIHRYWTALALIAAVVLAVVASVAFVLSRWVVRPLEKLESVAERVGKGDLQVRSGLEGPPEVRRLAETFNAMVSQLDVLVHSQDEFVADASHQLRTPMTALRLRLENMQRDAEPESARELGSALAEVERLSDLVDALLALAHADRALPAPRPVDLDRLVADRCDAWSAIAAEKGVTIDTRQEARHAPLATPGRLEQVLDNLIANALDATPSGSRIAIRTIDVGPTVAIHVEDEGPGMSAAQRERAFDRFWSGGETDGFGLGLAIVYRLVRNDGGTVALENLPGGGLDVTVSLPAGPTVGRRRTIARLEAVETT